MVQLFTQVSLILTLSLSLLNTAFTTNPTVNEAPSIASFGVQLVPNYTDAVTFSIVNVLDGKIVRIRHISRRELVLIATGAMRNTINPDQLNLFKEEGIEACDFTTDSVTGHVQYRCPCIDELWKLRYDSHPHSRKAQGWARNGGAPDAHQMELLRTFGVNRVHDVIYGKQFFALLRAMNSPAWVNSYK